MENGCSEKREFKILNEIPIAVSVCIPEAGYAPVFMNQAFLKLAGAGSSEACFRNLKYDFRNLLYQDDAEKFCNQVSALVCNPDQEDLAECRIAMLSGQVEPVRMKIRCTRDQKGRFLLICTVMDSSSGEIAEQADYLTGMMTIHSFFPAMERYRNQHPRQKLAVLFFDIIGFRRVNMHYGFTAGDHFLKEAGNSIRKTFPGMPAAHFEGDRFAVLAPCSGLTKKIAHLKEAFRSILPDLTLDCCAGAAVWDHPEEKPGTVCAHARNACEQNRNSSAETVTCFTEELGKNLETAEYVSSHLEEAVKNGWIRPYFQPVVRSLSEQLCGMEALARWEDPERGLLQPGVFIPPLERNLRIPILDLCMIRRTAAQIAEWEKQGLAIPVSINLSRVDFLNPCLFEEVEQAVREFDIPRELLHIEITESALASDEAEIFRTLDQFRKAGYEIWMDDFGSGYSTLNLLKNYPYDVLKLDMAFLKNDTPRGRLVICSIIRMCKSLGMHTLAEGVETEEQFVFLKNSGCDYIQGYFFGKPLPADACIQHCLDRPLSMETARQRKYYDAVSPVDFQCGFPLVLLEYRKKTFRLLHMNEEASSLLRMNRKNSATEAEQWLNGSSLAARKARQAADYAYHSGEDGELYLPVPGKELLCRFRMISRYLDQCLFAVTVQNNTGFNERFREKTGRLMNLCFLFYEICEIWPGEHAFRSLLFSQDTRKMPMRKADGTLSAMLPDVLPAERSRYEAFLDPDTLSERLEKSHGIMKEIFRTRDEQGNYVCMSHQLLKIPDEEETEVLYAVQSDKRGEKESSEVKPDLNRNGEELWNNLIEQVPIPLFWKDRNRRFLGASRSFLEFFGMVSAEDICGKTDEEMNWHPRDLAYMQEEKKLLKTGKGEPDVPGHCIAKGIDHHILATKWPIVRDGKIEGLMGYFIDEAMLARLNQSAVYRMGIDQATGLSNAAGFLDTLSCYEEDYLKEHHPFGILFIQVPELSAIAAEEGKEASEEALKQCTQAILNVSGSASCAARVGFKSFALLRKYSSADEIPELAERVRKEIGSVHRIGGRRCSLHARVRILSSEDSFHFSDDLVHALWTESSPGGKK
ncbi:MAG: EAL domain-containing protein [Bulleidia sp.]